MKSPQVRAFAGLALICVTLAASAFPAAHAGTFGSKYRTGGTCGPFPRVAVATPSWGCLGLVAGPEQGLVWPRTILEIGKGRFVVSDAAGWHTKGASGVFALDVAADGRASVTPLVMGRSLTHGLAMGPDGRVYVGDDDAIWRFDPKDPAPAPEVVLDGLPDKSSRGGDHAHPLKQIVFDRERNLLVNMGAPSDACEAGTGKPARTLYPCPWRDGAKPDAAIWRLELEWPEGRPGKFEPLARGLRNSLALAVHPTSGLIIQAENNIDVWGRRLDPNFPPEELNVILPGRDYGWPYCAGKGDVVPQYKRWGVSKCERFEPPVALIPAHAAPLSLLYYSGAMFPELEGKLVVALHGANANGRRVVAYDTDGDGRPKSPPGRKGRPGFPDVIIDDWVASRAGATGRPSGLTVASDGSLWIVDDIERTVMVFLRSQEGGAPSAREREIVTRALTAMPAGWPDFYGRVLSSRCQTCHAAFSNPDAGAAWDELVAVGMLDPGDVSRSPLVHAMTSAGRFRPMPPPSGAAPDDLAALQRFLDGLKN